MKPTLTNPKGTRATAPINAWGRQLQVTWMLSKSYSNEQTEEDETMILNLHRLRSLGYIEECIAWNPDGNFDRVSAAGMLFILREERLRRVSKLRNKETKKKKGWANSEFFKQSFEHKRPHRIQENKFSFEDRDKKSHFKDENYLDF